MPFAFVACPITPICSLLQRLRRLGVYLRAIVSDVATPELSVDQFPQSLSESQFDLPLSGWYWQVTRLDTPEPEVRSSRSLWDNTLPRLADPAAPSEPGELRAGYVEGPEGQPLRLVERSIDLGGEGRYVIAVAGDAGDPGAPGVAGRRAGRRHQRGVRRAHRERDRQVGQGGEGLGRQSGLTPGSVSFRS